ncbi:MAG: hypothetical protein LBK25_00965 [Treponema sp.]|nr:hypothetical protein [Treponema sp.]
MGRRGQQTRGGTRTLMSDSGGGRRCQTHGGQRGTRRRGRRCLSNE